MFSSNNAMAPAYAGGGSVPMSNYGMGGLSSLAPGIGAIASGFMGQGASPYSAAMGPYNQYMGKAAGQLNPFYQAGQGAIGNYQNWLQSMQNPSGFINNLMGQYQESPWAKFQQQQMMHSAQNMGSANGLLGSTPLTQFAEQQAQGISSQDMQNWLQNVLGINQQYGSGQAGLMQGGESAAGSLANLYGQQAQGAGNLAYGQQQGENQDMSNIIGGILSLI